MRAADKILRSDDLAAALERARARGAKIVFTNGVFDLLHVGHVRYLEFARSLGDLLVVAVNSDESVKALGKGPGRPIVPCAQRAEVVAALACVDFVCTFDEAVPSATIRALRPDVHVKSAQYRSKDLPEAQAVAEAGGEIVFAPHVDGTSTSEIVRRIASREHP